MIRLVESSPSTSSTLTGIFGKNLSAPSSSSLLPSLSSLAPIFLFFNEGPDGKEEPKDLFTTHLIL